MLKNVLWQWLRVLGVSEDATVKPCTRPCWISMMRRRLNCAAAIWQRTERVQVWGHRDSEYGAPGMRCLGLEVSILVFSTLGGRLLGTLSTQILSLGFRASFMRMVITRISWNRPLRRSCKGTTGSSTTPGEKRPWTLRKGSMKTEAFYWPPPPLSSEMLRTCSPGAHKPKLQTHVSPKPSKSQC